MQLSGAGPATMDAPPPATSAPSAPPAPSATPAPPAGTRSIWLPVGIVALCVAALPRVSSSVWPAKMAVLVVLGAAGLPVLVLRAWGVGLDTGRTRAPAIAAVAFVAVATASTFTSKAVGSAIVGVYQQGTGLIFVLALAGVWALATTAGDAGRSRVEVAIIIGAVANAAVAVVQQTVGFPSSVLGGNAASASGLSGNAAFFATLCVAALALLGGRFADDPRRWWLPVALQGIAVGTSGERLPALLVLGIVGVEVVAFLLRRRQGGPARVSGLVGFSTLAVGGMLAGSILSSVGNHLRGGSGGAGVIGRTAQSTTQSTFGVRFDLWRAAATSISHHPWLGAGPGQFRDATSGLMSLSVTRGLGGTIFADAHNLLVEYATTTGLLGLAALVAWLVLATLHRTGRLMVCAATIFVVGMAEPLNVVTTPLLFIALGAAAVGGRRTPSSPRGEPGVRASGVPGGRVGKAAVIACAALAALAGTALVVGDALYTRASNLSAGGNQAAAMVDAARADRLLFAWPEPATLQAQSQLLSGYTVTPQSAAAAIAPARRAVDRDPTDADLWDRLASVQLDAGLLADAHASAARAEQLRPWETATLNYLGLVTRLQGDPTQAHTWFGRSLQLDPTQKVTRSLYDYGCVAASIHVFLPANERCPKK